ncbi:S41 family peptidase [uncultured Pedobacter sp.]|uniref:S41 family peptidase n=1 Tax=uncultured Pedobacter sp. TaxID=246139 RepID=UPI0025D11A7A|nr:S41 family peptidase [uncultured Pedobacter sp.]
MKIHAYLLIILCVILQIPGYSQSNLPSRTTVKLNKEIFNILKNNSMFSDKLDWRNIQEESKILSLTTNDSTNKQVLYNFYTGKLRAAGDKHSFFISGKRMKQIAEAPVAEQPQGDYLGAGVAWVKVPRCLSFNEAKDAHFADTIRRIIQKLDTENAVEGWIVDLRHNTGGNMWPMLAGLNALVADGTAGYFVSSESMENKRPWPNENGKISGKPADISTYKIKNNSAKIAVLLDARTGSSGEMAAVSLLGLPNVKSFGQTSAGYTTANYTFNLSNGDQLQLARTYVADRTGKGYPENIKPDVFIDDLSNTKNDRVIAAAKTWLLEK